MGRTEYGSPGLLPCLMSLYFWAVVTGRKGVSRLTTVQTKPFPEGLVVLSEQVPLPRNGVTELVCLRRVHCFKGQFVLLRYGSGGPQSGGKTLSTEVVRSMILIYRREKQKARVLIAPGVRQRSGGEGQQVDEVADSSKRSSAGRKSR